MNEQQLHLAVCAYIREKYPKTMFNTDLSGVKLPVGLATKVRNMRSNNGYPDIVIYEQRKGYGALFIELKKDGTRLKNKGNEWANDHISRQAKVHELLINRNYLAVFAVGLNHAKSLIDYYLQDSE